jgi:hypothetical protein
MFTTLLLALLSSPAPALPVQTPVGHVAASAPKTAPAQPATKQHQLPEQVSITQRASALQQQLKQAAAAHHIDPTAARTVNQELAEVQKSVAELAPKQGFVSAAEKASYQRTFAKAEQLLAPGK